MNADGIAEVEKAIMTAVGSEETLEEEGNVILVLDGLDFLLAATECEVLGMLDMIGEIREVRILCQILAPMYLLNESIDEQHVYSTIISSAADVPLSRLGATPLEESHTALVMSLAHQARSIMSVRGLDTGAAKDVSGVLRISNGDECVDDGDTEERECLYYVGSDGGVKVFDRGA